MATIQVDHRAYDVADEQNLLAACLSRGLNLPYFCWHPALGSVGACRQCAVKVFKDEKDQAGRLVMACMTPVADGLRASIEDEEAATFRATVIEWLMANHPHDCPVCDEGGECHLQDMTVMTGHAYRRYRFPKRTFLNQDLGPFVRHEMNRCIECYRCVRFYRDYAGGRDFNVFASRNQVYFGRAESGVLENEFSGNLIEVCPTGVFTDKTLFHHYTRKWDLQSAPSLCVHCGIGCNTTPGERYGTLRRIVNRYNSRINGYFLCDRGRFGYEFVTSGKRIKTPLVRPSRTEALAPADPLVALAAVAARLGQGRVIGIGSPRASLESNYALRTLVGADHFFQGTGERDVRFHVSLLQRLREGPVASASIQEIEQSDAVFLLGEDALHHAPRLALAILQALGRQPARAVATQGILLWNDGAIRQASNGRTGPFYVAAHRRTWLHDPATEALYAAPDDLARLGYAVAHELDAENPDVPDLAERQRDLARRIASDLLAAEQPAVVSGSALLNEALLESAILVARALYHRGKSVKLALAVAECNRMGAALLGGPPLEAAQEAIRQGGVAAVLVLEQDLLRTAGWGPHSRLPEGPSWIVLDQLETGVTASADIVLPASTFAEGDGTLVNYEGRAQRHYQVYVPDAAVQEGWRWLREIARVWPESSAAGPAQVAGWTSLDDVVRDLCRDLPAFAAIAGAFPPAGLRIGGRKIPRQPERYSGRTAMRANLTMHEPAPPADPDSPFAFTMEGSHELVPPPLRAQTWAPGWNSNQSLHKFQEEIGGDLRGDQPGLLLIAPSSAERTEPTRPLPAAFEPRPDQWLAVPHDEIFGSDPLSAEAAALSTRIPQASLAMHPDDAGSKEWSPGQTLIVSVGAQQIALPLRVEATIPRGTVGISRVGECLALSIPGWCRIQMGGTA